MAPSIAIVGMACRYPDAADAGELWSNVLASRRAFRRIPAERLPQGEYWSVGDEHPDHTYGTHAALIEGYEFDRLRYRVSGQAFQEADAVHWLALDVAAHAIEDAGFGIGVVLPQDTSAVIVGNTLTGEFSRANSLRLRWPYVRRTVDRRLAVAGWEEAARLPFLDELERDYKAPFPAVGAESLAGALSNTIAGRICNHFDLHGGGYTVDAACAASLLAVTTACSGLVAGDFDVVVAGGVDVSLDPFELVGFARLGALARSMMRVYDRRSEGFWPGEGCGFVVLTRLDDAIALGMRPYAVLRGWGISSDGSGGITRPEPEGQRLALERAYTRAEFGIDSVAYFEGHGTGTPVGDRVEVEALLAARRARGAAVPALLGSIKANIGHTKAAAGVAGLIKAAMAVHTHVLPPTTGCDQPLVELCSGQSLTTSKELQVWPSSHPLRASVSAMGFGGINTHITLEGMAADRRRTRLTAPELEAGATAQDAETFLFSAGSFAELARAVDRVTAVAESLSMAELGDASASVIAEAAPGAGLHGAVVAGSVDELAVRLAALRDAIRQEWAPGRLAPGVHLAWAASRPRIGYLFPGQASPPNRDGGALRQRFRTVAAMYGSASLEAGRQESDTAAVQPAIVTGSAAGLVVLADLGLEADVGLGHSLGELSAYHWAGVMSWRDLLATARVRGAVMAEVGGVGAMLSVAGPVSTVQPLLAEGVVVACLNSPSQTILSGVPEALAQVAMRAAARGLTCSRLPVSHAFHSPQMRPAITGLKRQLDSLRLQPPDRRLVSSITGNPVEAGDDLKQLLLEQLTSPVRFQAALEAMCKEVDLVVEVGPGQVLARLAEEVLGAPVYSVDAGGRSLRGLLDFVAAAYVAGASVEPTRLLKGRRLKTLDLDRRPRFFVNPCENNPSSEELPTMPAVEPLTSGLELEASDPLEVLRQLVCARAELPESAVQDQHRFLSDLHLNSIAVAQLLVDAAAQLQVRTPHTGLDFANASLLEAADALSQLSPVGSGEDAAEPPGAVEWVHLFRVELVADDLPADVVDSDPPAGWQLECEAGHPLRELLEPIQAELPGHGTLIVVGAENPAIVFERLLGAVPAVRRGQVVFIEEAGAIVAGGFAKSLHLESSGSAVKVIGVPVGDPRTPAWIRAEAALPGGFAEVVYDSSGSRRAPLLRALEAPTASSLPLGPQDVVLISGGGKGISAEAALALARATGCRVALMGRSDSEQDPELAANLQRFADSGVPYRYLRADVTDSKEVHGAVAQAVGELGPITALVHGAGINEPHLVKDLSLAQAMTVIAPKCEGLDNLLAALEPSQLRLVVGFGSVIARSGLQGEAHYAFANDWMRSRVERHGIENPTCRCLCIEWSVWSGVGMGERLQTVQMLRALGVTPISVEQGLRALTEALSLERAESVVVTGRLGGLPTVRFDRLQHPFLRFLEDIQVSYPTVELVAEAELSLATDPYLGDHLFGGEALLPAVVGLEAMAQAVSAVATSRGPFCFEDVAFIRPLVVGRSGVSRVRVAASAAGSGGYGVVLRADATGFQVDHFRARCSRGRAPEPLFLRSSPDRRLDLDPARDLYGSLFFQGGPFRRVLGYSELSAFSCSAELSGTDPGGWFARHLPSDLILGDPGIRDAALHALQACLPGIVVLPVGVAEIRIHSRGEAEGKLRLQAVERESDGDSFVWDIELRDESGSLVETWRGLILKRLENRPIRPDWPSPLLAAVLERQFRDVLGQRTRIEVSRAAIRQIGAAPLRTPDGLPLKRRPDGKPDATPRHASAAYASDLVVAVVSDDAVTCDLEPVEYRPPDTWTALLGGSGFALARTIAKEVGEDLDVAATRAWSAGEALKKLGLSNQSMVIDVRSGVGQVGLRAGLARVETLLLPAAGEAAALIATVARLDGDA